MFIMICRLDTTTRAEWLCCRLVLMKINSTVNIVDSPMDQITDYNILLLLGIVAARLRLREFR